MKIIVIDINNEYGGGQVFAKNVLAKLDGEILFLVRSKQLSLELDNVILLEESNFFKICLEIKKKLENFVPDVVILNGGLALFIPLFTFKRWKYIFYKHSTYLGVSIKKRIIFFILLNLSYLKARKIICVSRYCAKEELFFNKKIIIIHHGVDLQRVQKKNNNETDKLIFIYVGRIVKSKGVDLILEYFYNTNIKDREVIIVGDEEKSDFDISKYKNIPSIHFVGLKNNPFDYYKNADFLITLPTDEAFGLTIIEAMASECVVIATKVGGIPEIITDRENGYLIKPSQLFSFLDNLKNKNEYKNIKLNALKTVENFFLIENEIYKINETIRSIV